MEMRFICASARRLRSFLTIAQITQVKIISDRDGKPKGFGYVEFASLEGLKFGLSKHGIVGSFIFCSWVNVDEFIDILESSNQGECC